MSSKKYIVLNMVFKDGGVGWSQFVLPKEKKLYRKELRWLKSENKEQECIKCSCEYFSEEEIVILDYGNWQPKAWRRYHSIPIVPKENSNMILFDGEEFDVMERELEGIIESLEGLNVE